MEPAFSIKSRWREREFLLVTLLILLAIAGCIKPLFAYSADELEKIFGQEFTQAQLPFAYFRDILFPNTGFLVLIYACYCWMSGYILPRLLPALAPAARGEDVNYRKLTAGLLQIILLITFLGIGWGISDGLSNPFEGRIPSILRIGNGLQHSTPWVVGYLAYALLRERAVRLLDPNGISLLNSISGFMLIYFTAGSLMYNFQLLDPGDFHGFYDLYFVVVPPVVLAALTNLYWIFPFKGSTPVWKWPVLRGLLLSTACWSAPFAFFGVPDEHARLPVFFGLWFGQLAIMTPISWFIYRQHKDKLLQLQGLRTALGKSEADLRFLRSQINPHFLFNALNTLYGTALQEQADRTAGGIQRLGDMMRFMLHENHLQSIPMSKEIEYLKNYIALMQLRTQASNSILIETIIDDECPGFSIAPMLLIPFVENGFKHGISLREPSWLKLRLHCEQKRIVFEMRNSIHVRQGDDPEKDRSGIGLRNVLHRLKLLYPDRHEIYMHQDEKEFFVQLTIQP
jgi:histidine kinase